MANTYTPSAVAQNLARVGSQILQARLAPLPKFCTVIDVIETEPPMLAAAIPFATVAATGQSGTAIDFDSGDTTYGLKSLVPTTYAQCFSVGNAEIQSGIALTHLAAVNVEAFAQTLSDVVMTLITSANYGQPLVTVNSSAFGGGDFSTLFAGIASPNRAVILDTGYFSRVSPLWLPPGFSNVHEHSRWTAAGSKVRGFVCDPRAILLRYGIPWVHKNSDRVLARELVQVPQLGIGVEVAVWFNVQTRTIQAAYAVVLGCCVGEANALKLLASLD